MAFRYLASQVRKRRWLPTVAWCVAILALSSLPDPGLAQKGLIGCDKVLHFIEYSILGMALRYWSSQRKKQFLAGAACFAALNELYQIYIPTRNASFGDFLADVSGIFVGFLVSKRFMKKG